ncbi:MAG: hypothetical protein KF729_26650 [Sandaracinaceae bacterium]|nr:hypothetical protein [Sandaracinaceae bacterium]
MLGILDQIEGAKNAGLYYVALLSALAVPDIAGAIDAQNGRATRSAYAKWFDTHLGPKYQASWGQALLGADCYHFRCSMLHQGTAVLQHSKAGFSQLLFVEPSTSRVTMHKNIINGALNIDVNIFCQDIVDAGRAWHRAASGTPLYGINAAKCVARHPDGLAPYIVGIPCIG